MKATDETLNKRKERFGTLAEDVCVVYFLRDYDDRNKN